MSLEYYMLCRDEYNNIICQLKEIINRFDIIIDRTISENNIQNSLLKIEKNKNFFIDKLKNIEEQKNICYSKIQQLCRHEFVDDLIDINPDTSISIKYCQICEFTCQGL